jgi:hypothetical protein
MGESPMGGSSNVPAGDSNSPDGRLSKNGYKPPRLCSYGTLRDITLSNKFAAGQDNSGRDDHKTHF